MTNILVVDDEEQIRRLVNRSLSRVGGYACTLAADGAETRKCPNSEINTLGYPPAAIFAFCVALVSYMILSIIKAALSSVYGAAKIDKKFSG